MEWNSHGHELDRSVKTNLSQKVALLILWKKLEFILIFGHLQLGTIYYNFWPCTDRPKPSLGSLLFPVLVNKVQKDIILLNRHLADTGTSCSLSNVLKTLRVHTHSFKRRDIVWRVSALPMTSRVASCEQMDTEFNLLIQDWVQHLSEVYDSVYLNIKSLPWKKKFNIFYLAF